MHVDVCERAYIGCSARNNESIFVNAIKWAREKGRNEDTSDDENFFIYYYANVCTYMVARAKNKLRWNVEGRLLSSNSIIALEASLCMHMRDVG